MVKVFYFNMGWDNLVDNEGNIVEERITTHLRGTPITISAAYLNSVLNLTNPPPPAEIKYSDRQIWDILRPNEPVPEALDILTFKPVEMPPVHRAVWYIYTRNLMQKGGHFTTFAKKDYPIFASIMDKTPHNVGHWLFQEIARFRFGSRKNSDIPFPSLISVILFHERMWYLGRADPPVTPTVFGMHQIHLMKLNLREGSGQSRAPSQSRPTRPVNSRVQEAQSAPSSYPSDLDSRIQAIVDKAISEMQEKIEVEVGKLVAEVKTGNSDSVDAQVGMKETLDNVVGHLEDHDAKLSTMMISQGLLDDKMDKVIKLLTSGLGTSSTAGPSFSSPTFTPKYEPNTSSPSFTFTTPIISTIPQASSPTTEIIPPSPTSTVKLDTPLPEQATSPNPPFGDDKGGEE